MKLLTKDIDYAIRALLVLAKDEDKCVSAKKISEDQNIPYQFLRRLLQRLIQHKIIKSKEGITGGVKLLKKPENIHITDLINIFQGKMKLIDCMFKKDICPNRGTCVLRPEILRIEKLVVDEFSKLTIKTLLLKM